jgi:hypothetical protein
MERTLNIREKLGIKNPVNQIILVFEVVIKALPVHITSFHYVAYPNFLHGALSH